ncbi:MAG: hypothetical protein ACJAWV_001919, partial [Flammeovirgaceae bacterium]
MDYQPISKETQLKPNQMKNKITIAEPCTESWEKMAQTGKTDCAFCQSCQKEVIDFTQK